MNKIKFSVLLVNTLLSLAFTKSTLAIDTLFFDSTNNYLGTCQLTDKSTWELTEDSSVTTFQIWYSWNQNESTLPVTLYKDGKEFAKFEATRSSCDPYQKQWCNADYNINTLFPKGVYSTQIPNPRQCLKPGGTGAIRLYKEVTPPATPTITTAPSPTVTITPTTTIVPSISLTPPCPCNQNTIIITAVGGSAGVSLLINILFKALRK